MTVKELIADLEKIPEDYKVQIHLCECPSEEASKEEVDRAFDNTIAISTYLATTQAVHEEKTVYICGATFPAPEKPFQAGMN